MAFILEEQTQRKQGGRVDERTAVTAGALIGAVVGAAASYLFFTEGGRHLRNRIEPAIEDLQREFVRFQGTIQQVGRMAGEGARVVQEFSAARGQQFPGSGTSH
jgi:gas vesicle protein